ncbi:OprO/OprP family phosphate-selective porin [Maricaulis sp.]|uniref:OprO/OprP family phosphate-selective porin n=1 Tax=Maricaulis sp. TaxID=1486257 RepID=UPI003A954F1B
MKALKFAAAILGLFATTAPAALSQTWEFSMNPGPRWDSPTTSDYFKFRGRAYFDIADVDWSSPLSAAPTDDEEWRTLWFGIEGQIGNLKLVAEYDWLPDDPAPTDVHLTYRLPQGSVRVGNFKTMNSMEEQTSSLNMSFMERGLLTDIFGIDRRLGAAYFWSNDNFTVSAGLYGGKMEDNFQLAEADDSSAFAGRLTWHTETDAGTTLHLGASFRSLDYDGGARLRDRPQAHLANNFATADYRTGQPLGEAESSDLIALEAAIIRGPFWAHGEFARMTLDGPAGDPAFDSGFASLGYILTGETRGYRGSSGVFGGISPNSALSAGGHGAWEIAARADYADMGDAGLGTIETLTLGINWYVERYARVMFNYVSGEHDAPTYTETSDVAQLRLQVGF